MTVFQMLFLIWSFIIEIWISVYTATQIYSTCYSCHHVIFPHVFHHQILLRDDCLAWAPSVPLVEQKLFTLREYLCSHLLVFLLLFFFGGEGGFQFLIFSFLCIFVVIFLSIWLWFLLTHLCSLPHSIEIMICFWLKINHLHGTMSKPSEESIGKSRDCTIYVNCITKFDDKDCFYQIRFRY